MRNVTCFFEARDIADSVCPEGLRMLEAARRSMANFSLYALDGKLLERNAAFVREFDAALTPEGDRFLALFADAKKLTDEFAGSISPWHRSTMVKPSATVSLPYLPM